MRERNGSLKFILVVIVALIILTPGFYRNQWLAAGRKWFYDWRKIQEGFVIARIIESRGSGILSHGGLMGLGCATAYVCDWESSDLEQDYITYMENGRYHSYLPYTSHPGLQGILFSLFEQATDFSPNLNIRLFHGAVSVLSAFVLGLFIYWVLEELGTTAGLLALLFIAVSEWLTMFGGNIFWNIWAFYLPLMASSLYLMKASKTKSYNQKVFALILATTMFIKCLFTGFEFITTAFIMPLIPFIYYTIRDSWGWTTFLRRIFSGAVSLSTGIASGLFTLIGQIMHIKNGFRESVAPIFSALERRTFGDPEQYVNEAESLKASLFPVLMQYINGRAILLRQIITIRNNSIEINYLTLFLVFLTLTILLLISMRSKVYSATKVASLALIITTWASVLAPLSWFIIFKSHSYIHTQTSFIVWQMPFTLYGFALCGYTLEFLASGKSKRKQ